ncbi:MAG: 7-cyano-7-deazaguanine synthase [Acidobacteria bacterium]|nr:7-cyano-7-deazaguanine synthase [Acidobacteriota bacterium]MDW7983968.1 7-cyano-7-deazaguanine synthase [Acidobacteriota bacterium]
MPEVAIVLFSGGLDSTVALWWVRYQDWKPVPLSVDYAGRPRGEREAAREIAAVARVEILEVALPFYRDLQAWRREGVLPGDLAGVNPVYLPAKNLLFYAIAAYYAEVLGATRIVGGHYRHDGILFPDASTAYFARLGDLIADGLYSHRPRLELPFLELAKDAVVQLGLALGAPLGLTWSCYWDGPMPCGQCEGCQEKEAALRTVGRSEESRNDKQSSWAIKQIDG